MVELRRGTATSTSTRPGTTSGTETARCAFETVVPPAVALAAVRALLQDELAV